MGAVMNIVEMAVAALVLIIGMALVVACLANN